MGRALGKTCVTNIWIPDGMKDTPADRNAPRARLAESLDAIFKKPISPKLNLDAVEPKLFGIGSESYVVGSHEFYLGYAVIAQKTADARCRTLSPDRRHCGQNFQRAPILPEILLHVSRGVRWDSDHVVILNDDLLAIAREIVANGFEKRVHIGLDYFDASINRVAAWTIGARNLLRALLIALLEPAAIKAAEARGDFTARLALQEEAKTLPFGAVWDFYCESKGVPAGEKWLAEVKLYEENCFRQTELNQATHREQCNRILSWAWSITGWAAWRPARFYVPYKGVRKWSWETFWLAGGMFSWLICPWIGALALSKDLFAVLHETSSYTFWMTYLMGALWGLGGLTFGLTMRYLGMSLGMAVALGYCAAFGTLVPPIVKGEFAAKLLQTHGGHICFLGVIVCLVGIAIGGIAGVRKERDMGNDGKSAAIAEFNLWKGLAIATFSGIMSSCFSYGFQFGDPITKISANHGTGPYWVGLPVILVILLGGLTTNFIWCVLLNIKNRPRINISPRTSKRRPARRRAVVFMAAKPPPRLSKPAAPCRWFRTGCSARWRERSGISSSSSTRWARARWATTNFPVGRCTWRASSFSARCGAFSSRNGAAPAG